jgi:hypothetical protein
MIISYNKPQPVGSLPFPVHRSFVLPLDAVYAVEKIRAVIAQSVSAVKLTTHPLPSSAEVKHGRAILPLPHTSSLRGA